MEEMTKEAAIAKISDLVYDASQAIRQAEAIADLYNLDFMLEIGGYGMGGWYDGVEGEWNPSSLSC